MKDKDFVQSIYPSANCIIDPVVVDPWVDGLSQYLIVAIDTQDRSFLLGFSDISEEAAWLQIADSFRHKMLNQLEESHDH